MPSGLETTLVILAWAYVAALAVWFAARLLLGDRALVLFFFNSFAHVGLLPAPIVLVIGVAAGNVALAAAGAIASLLCLAIWGLPLLRQLRSRGTAASEAQLRVATFNLLWLNEDIDAIIAVLRSLDADVIALQEVSPLHASAIAADLGAEYPHQLLYPRDGADGAGMISRLPLSAVPGALPDPDWIGDAIVADVSLDGCRFVVAGCHAAPVRLSARARERQSRALVAYAHSADCPLIAMGDFNSTPLHIAYSVLSRGLDDVWASAGRGWGHTFPGAAWARARGDGLPRPLRRFVPRWLIRIDHIFVSSHWHAVSAHTGPSHGGSDHRPVIADLRLRE